ncbi:MAG: hypothetical protein WBP13_03030 [Methylophilaceae bacterium]
MELDHSSATQRVVVAISAMANNATISEDDLVALLQTMGYSRIAAEKLNAFVPSAFAWPLMKKLGLESLPNHFVALSKDGSEVQIPIGSQHYFTAALTLAYSTLENGWSSTVPRKTYEIVAGRSAEMDATNKVLNKGGSLDGANWSPLILHRLKAEELLSES